MPLSRNKTIIEVLGKLGIMDKRGTGFLRIREAMKKWDLPQPEFEEKTGYFVIKFVNPAIQKIPEIDESKLNERQMKALEYIKVYGKITSMDYRKLCLVVKDTANRDLVDLIKKRIIKKEGIGRAVFYRLFNEADK